jgi:hypothetical protein
MDDLIFVATVEAAAERREEPPIPREFIVKAVERIREGKENVVLYPSGDPPLMDVFDIAKRLRDELLTRH